MINGKSSGSGKYIFESRSSGNRSVYVSKMPEDTFLFRIAFTHHGETQDPIIKLDLRDAQLLWAALNATAKNLEWKDYDQT